MAWVVVVEESVGSGQGVRWAVGTVRGGHADRDRARAVALDLARRHAPRHPWSEQKRRVFKLSEDGYLVNVTGATADFHYRVTVAEEI